MDYPAKAMLFNVDGSTHRKRYKVRGQMHLYEIRIASDLVVQRLKSVNTLVNLHSVSSSGLIKKPVCRYSDVIECQVMTNVWLKAVELTCKGKSATSLWPTVTILTEKDLVSSRR